MPSTPGRTAERPISVRSSSRVVVVTRRSPSIGKNQMARSHGLHQGIPPERGARPTQTSRCPGMGSQYGSWGGSETSINPTNPLGPLSSNGYFGGCPCPPGPTARTHYAGTHRCSSSRQISTTPCLLPSFPVINAPDSSYRFHVGAWGHRLETPSTFSPSSKNSQFRTP